MDFSIWLQSIANHWPIWFVTVVMIVAAVIDGIMLKVPNWLTFPFILAGWAYSTQVAGLSGFGYSVLGTFVGFALLLWVRAVGGMGMGDVKLLGGLGAWIWTTNVVYAFAWTVVVGALMALVMIFTSGKWREHLAMSKQILNELITIRNPDKLAAIARQRKPSMKLLPYGIPMAIGSVLYFAYAGMLV
jgi:prepilin peptidase CpaA